MREVGRDPVERGQIEVALLDIAVERRELVGPDIERDPDPPQHRLHRFAKPPPLGRGLVDELQIARPRRSDWIAGLVEQLGSLERIIWIALHAAVVGPILGREHPARHPSGAFIQRADDRLAVDRIGNRLAHAKVAQMRIAEVELQIVIFAARRLIDHRARAASPDSRADRVEYCSRPDRRCPRPVPARGPSDRAPP